MAREGPITREAREKIKEQIREKGIAEIDGVVAFIKPFYSFDPDAAKEREMKSYARRLLASVRNDRGERVLYAIKGEPGTYARLDCNVLRYVQKIVEQLTDKRDGLDIQIKRGNQIIREIKGQVTFDDVLKSQPQEGARPSAPI